MKKILLLTMMCFLALFGNVRAQETIEIGEDKTPAGGYNLPTYDFNQYSISQQIYTEAEMEGKTGNITDVSFRLSSSKSASVKRTYAVYMKSTDLTAFADGNSFFQLSESDKVFEGQVELPTAAGSWYTINFDTPFKYTGGNFMLCVYDKTGSQTSMSDFSMFYQYSTTENASIHKNAWGNTPLNVSSLSGGTVVASKNQIKLTFVAAEEEPDPTPDPEPDPTPDPEDPGDEQPSGLTTVEIGEDKQLKSDANLPVNDFYKKYSMSQQIFLEEDFDDNYGLIKSISFKLANKVNPSSRRYEIYVKSTELEVLSDYIPVTNDDKVFDGTIEISGDKDSWLYIPFTKTFEYAGGNLMVCVYDKTGAKELDKNYHEFYVYNVETNRAKAGQQDDAIDMNNLPNNYFHSVKKMLNQVKFEIGSKPLVKVVPETIDLGEAMLGNYWTEKKAAQKVSVKTVSTVVTKIECDNDFFVLPENIDFTANPVTFDVTYNTEAEAEGEVTGNITITSQDSVAVVPVKALAYTPQEGDVYELAKEITFVERKYADNLKFDELHDNYFLPRERVDGNANDAVYSFELEEEKIIIAKVKGTNANLSIYDTTFNGKGGPSNDNSYKGSVAVSSDFYYDFNDGFLIDWVSKDYDGDGYSWENTPYYGVDGTNCVVSYSSHTTNGILRANNVLMTENTYLITENSVLSFDASNYIQSEVGIDHIKVEVSKDGESFVFIEEITPGDAQKYEHFSIELGAEFEALGLEYGDYYIALRHEEQDKMYVCVDNIQLTNNAKSKTRASEVSIYAVPYPAGKYYAVAAAESDFTFEMMLVNEDELPLAPENVVATTIDEFSIELSWIKAQNATSYNVYRNDELVANVKDTTYVDEDLAHNTDYCYVVRGYNDILESVPSAKACAKTNKLSLAIPDSIVAFPGSTSSIVLSWSKVDKAAGYEIYRGEDVIDVVEDTTYTVEGLMPGEECCCMVAAINRGVKSEKSDVVCANALNLEPGIPANLKVEATSTTSVVLTWDTTANAKRYYIYSADTLVAKTAYTTYNIVKLEYNTEYCFTVTAVNGELESEKSQEACGKTLGEGVEELSSSINVYPNPVENELILATELQVEEISIYDVYGRQAMRQQVGEAIAQQVVDVADLEAGVYFVKIVTSNNEVVRRFVKK